MKIVPIVEGKIYSLKYPKEKRNEYERLLDLWTDPEYLYTFAKDRRPAINNNFGSIEHFIDEIAESVEVLDESIQTIAKNKKLNLDNYFIPFHDTEHQIVSLSLRKRKCKHLRLYAVKVDKNLFVITSGGIKTTRTTQEDNNLTKAISKLNKCKDYLKDNHICDDLSFYEFLNPEL